MKRRIIALLLTAVMSFSLAACSGSKEKATEKINKNIEIQNEKLAIIPTEFKTEIFCWEISGKQFGRDFLIYVNAKTGVIENILVVTDTQNGILTM